MRFEFVLIPPTLHAPDSLIFGKTALSTAAVGFSIADYPLTIKICLIGRPNP